MLVPVQVAVGVIRQGERVLVARRPRHVHQGGLLEFPGGKVEPGESVPVALARELSEELGITADPAVMLPLLQVPFHYADKYVLLDVLEVPAFSGDPAGREGQDLFWLRPDELDPVDFPAANRPIITALGLPEFWMISGPFTGAEQALHRLRCALEGGSIQLLTLRAPWLDVADYRALATEAHRLCQVTGARLLLHGDPVLWQGLACDGYHLPQSVAAACLSWPPPGIRAGLLAVSCHNRAELEHAVRVLKADLVTLSPVQVTRSHPESPVLGWPEFQHLGRDLGVPVYALGGMTPADLPVARRYGARGIAAIGASWPY